MTLKTGEMERIYIPTVNRAKDQITFEGLPKTLQDKTTLVVQSWERDQYYYDCDYLVLPEEITLSDYLCLAKTRDFIHKTGRNQKYVMVDDDVRFKRRNSKYSTGISDMEKSNRQCNEEDILEMFQLCSGWLDEPEVSFCGPAHSENPPSDKAYSSNAALTNCVFYNGPDFSPFLEELHTTEVRYAEDTLFILSLLSKGFGNRVSQIFCLENVSLKGKLQDTVWNKTEYNDVWRDHNRIQEIFPDFFKVLLDKHGNRVSGGFRNFGKVRTSYSMCYKASQKRKETTTGYDNLVATMEEYEKVEKPKKPEKQPDYPFKLEVHIFSEGHCNRFAETIGKALSSNRKRFVYNDGKRVLSKNATFTELRSNPISKKTKHKTRIESQHWRNTVDFSQDAFVPYITFTVTFRTPEQHAKFAKRVKQKLTLNKKSIRFPQRRERIWKYQWVSQWEDCNPRYPVYIVSKGRADSRLTAKTFEKCNIPYYIVIEPQEYDEYAFLIDPKKILILPFSNHGDGPGRARNWCWDHSLSNGFKRHWVCDDNINGFIRLHRGRRHPVADGGMFRVIEEFVDRYKNVPIAGPQYRFHALESESYPPFVLNTRIYSCLLIENSCEYRWRGRYNEDTIICLDVLKAGHCTMLFNNLLQNKIVTQAMKGGNTDEFYDLEGTYKKSLMLEAEHPDVAKVVWRYNRWHHDVDYKPFKVNKLQYIEGYVPAHNRAETDNFDFERVKI